VDFLSGLVLYAVTTWLFGRGLNLFSFSIVVFFAVAPDLDTIPFLLLRRRLGLVSHWIIHFPLLYIPIGVTLVWFITRDWFYAINFMVASFAHFLHDSASAPGIQWFWPISKTACAFEGFKFVRVTPEERRRFYDRLREGAIERSMLQEVLIRIGRWRPKWFKLHK